MGWFRFQQIVPRGLRIDPDYEGHQQEVFSEVLSEPCTGRRRGTALLQTTGPSYFDGKEDSLSESVLLVCVNLESWSNSPVLIWQEIILWRKGEKVRKPVQMIQSPPVERPVTLSTPSSPQSLPDKDGDKNFTREDQDQVNPLPLPNPVNKENVAVSNSDGEQWVWGCVLYAGVVLCKFSIEMTFTYHSLSSQLLMMRWINAATTTNF